MKYSIKVLNLHYRVAKTTESLELINTITFFLTSAIVPNPEMVNFVNNTGVRLLLTLFFIVNKVFKIPNIQHSINTREAAYSTCHSNFLVLRLNMQMRYKN